MLSQDYLTVPLDEVGDIESVLTLLGGEVVYAAGDVRGARELKETGMADTTELALRCRCGTVRGVARDVDAELDQPLLLLLRRLPSVRAFSGPRRRRSRRARRHARSRRCRKANVGFTAGADKIAAIRLTTKGIDALVRELLPHADRQHHGHERDAVHRRDATRSSTRRRPRSARFAAAASRRARKAAPPRCRRTACRRSSWSRACSRSCIALALARRSQALGAVRRGDGPAARRAARARRQPNARSSGGAAREWRA